MTGGRVSVSAMRRRGRRRRRLGRTWVGYPVGNRDNGDRGRGLPRVDRDDYGHGGPDVPHQRTGDYEGHRIGKRW